MKKAVVFFIILIITVFLIACVTCEKTANVQLYPLSAVVVNLDFDNDIVTCEDTTGNLWQFFDCADFAKGDALTLIMNDKGTLEFSDDEIIDIYF